MSSSSRRCSGRSPSFCSIFFPDITWWALFCVSPKSATSAILWLYGFLSASSAWTSQNAEGLWEDCLSFVQPSSSCSLKSLRIYRTRLNRGMLAWFALQCLRFALTFNAVTCIESKRPGIQSKSAGSFSFCLSSVWFQRISYRTSKHYCQSSLGYTAMRYVPRRTPDHSMLVG